jgi:thiol-disulfide isomerase/thioredoxin
MKSPRLLLANLLLLAALTARASSADTSQVDQLARAGYWLPDNASAFKEAMGLLHKPPPSLKLSDWHGTAPTAQDLKGKIILIDFWATWCGPCLAQIPHANAIRQKYADQGVYVYGVCCPKGSNLMAKTADAKSMQYPTAKLTNADVAAWRIAFYPTYAIIDRHNKVRAIGLRPDYVEQVLDALLEEQPSTATP